MFEKGTFFCCCDDLTVCAQNQPNIVALWITVAIPMIQHVIHMWSDVLQVFMWLNHCSDQTIQWPKVNTALIYEMLIKFEHYTSPSWKLAACWCQPICLSKHWYSNMTKDVPSMHHMAAFKWTLYTLCDQLFKSISTTSLLSIFQKTICTSSK